MRVEIKSVVSRCPALRGMGNVVVIVSVMWWGIRVNLLYRRLGAASARLVSVVALEAAALACRGHLSQQEKGLFIVGVSLGFESSCFGECSGGVVGEVSQVRVWSRVGVRGGR